MITNLPVRPGNCGALNFSIEVAPGFKGYFPVKRP